MSSTSKDKKPWLMDAAQFLDEQGINLEHGLDYLQGVSVIGGKFN